MIPGSPSQASDEQLRTRIDDLQSQNAALAHRIGELESAGAMGRKSRLAALNLLEDAVAARRKLQLSEEKLRQREKELAQVQVIGSVGGMNIDIAGGLTGRRSPEYLRLHGLADNVEEESHEDWLRRVHPEDRKRVDRILREALEGRGAVYESEYRIIRPSDGEERWIFARGDIERDRTGRAVRLVGAHIDITDRKLAEQRVADDLLDTEILRELGARLDMGDGRDLYDRVVYAAMAITRAQAGAVQVLNEETRELVLLATYGFSRETTEHFHRLDAGSLTSCGMALTSNQRAFVDFDVPPEQDRKGEMRMLVEAGYRCAQSTPLITRAGKTIGMVSTHWRVQHHPSERELRFLDLLARQAADLIERKMAEDALKTALQESEKAHAEVKAAGRAKDHFLAMLSHELRTPLTPISLIVEDLMHDPDIRPSIREDLHVILRNVKVECRLIDDLLDLSRIVHGKFEILYQETDLHDVIREAVSMVESDIAGKKQTFTADLVAGHSQVSGDPMRLQQVIWNLLKNATKFTPAGGNIVLRTANEESKILVTVTDTGIGMDPETIGRIFEAFSQGNEEITRKFGGLGLGLAISNATLAAHGAALSASSPGPGHGATFSFQLPLSA